MVNDSAVVVFDDERAVANAGVMLPAALATRLGIEQLVDQTVDLTLILGDGARRGLHDLAARMRRARPITHR